MSWDSTQAISPRLNYRLLDAPLTRYILGFGRTLRGLPALPTDWDWSKTWEENSNNQAMPNRELLLTGRATIAMLLPFSLIFLYLSGKRIANPLTGLLAALFLGTNGLILLHTRRAMAEGPLVFAITMSLWSFLEGDKRPWMAGIAAALAFSAKQSALALMPVGLLAVCWVSPPIPIKWSKLGRNTLQYLLSFMLVVLVLNPVFWKSPIRAAIASWQARQDLLARQVSEIRSIAPEKVLDTPSERLVSLTGNLFIAPLSFAEIGNYSTETQETEIKYLSNPLYNLWRGVWAGGINLSLVLLGIIFTLVSYSKVGSDKRRSVGLLFIGTMLLFITIIIFVPLPWQRYSVILVPFTCLWAAIGIDSLFKPVMLWDKSSWPD